MASGGSRYGRRRETGDAAAASTADLEDWLELTGYHIPERRQNLLGQYRRLQELEEESARACAAIQISSAMIFRPSTTSPRHSVLQTTAADLWSTSAANSDHPTNNNSVTSRMVNQSLYNLREDSRAEQETHPIDPAFGLSRKRRHCDDEIPTGPEVWEICKEKKRTRWPRKLPRTRPA